MAFTQKDKKRTNDILEWINAFITLVDLDIKYFELSISSENKTWRKKYRQISEEYHKAIKKLIDLLP